VIPLGPVVTTLVCFLQFAREAMGASWRPAFPAPSVWAPRFPHELGRIAPREGGPVSGRHCERSEAIHEFQWAKMDCFAALAM